MLFDLRGRGRRRTVQVVYLGLAVIMGGGLILFGVGTGTGNGGLLNAFTGGGSGNSQASAMVQQEKAAAQRARRSPNDPAAWSALINARWAVASSGTNYDSTTNTFTASGKSELSGVTDAWQRYLALTKSPDPTLATLAAESYAHLGNYAGAASAWEIQSAANPRVARGYECLAVNAYAAGQTRKGDLALAKALTLTPKLGRKTVKSEIEQAKTTPSIAQSC